MAENHPVGFQWVMEAREHGAKMIHVDPRFTRTSAMADMWMPLRAGHRYRFPRRLDPLRSAKTRKISANTCVNYTNASVILRDEFQDTEDSAEFSRVGCRRRKQYKTESWAISGIAIKQGCQPEHSASGGHAKDRGGEKSSEPSIYEQDLTLQNPCCVYQVLKTAFFSLHAGNGRAVLWHFAGRVSEHCGNFLLLPPAQKRLPQSVTPWDGRNIPTACRSFVPRRFCSCCSATSAAPAAAFSRCVATHRFRVQPTFRLFTNSARLLADAVLRRGFEDSGKIHRSTHIRKPVGGTTSTNTS